MCDLPETALQQMEKRNLTYRKSSIKPPYQVSSPPSNKPLRAAEREEDNPSRRPMSEQARAFVTITCTNHSNLYIRQTYGLEPNRHSRGPKQKVGNRTSSLFLPLLHHRLVLCLCFFACLFLFLLLFPVMRFAKFNKQHPSVIIPL